MTAITGAERTMKVIYVTGAGMPDSGLVMQELAVLEPGLEFETVEGAAEALVRLRGDEPYRAVLLGPSLPHNEALALIAAVRRDRVPAAVIAIVTETNSTFLAQALAAGADDVLWMSPDGVTATKDTLHRIRHNRHAGPAVDQDRLLLLYVGEDDQAWSVLHDLA